MIRKRKMNIRQFDSHNKSLISISEDLNILLAHEIHENIASIEIPLLSFRFASACIKGSRQ